MAAKPVKPFPRFRTWLKAQTHRENVVGLLAEDIVQSDRSGFLPMFPDASAFETYRLWVDERNVCSCVVMRALRAAWNVYHEEKATYEGEH